MVWYFVCEVTNTYMRKRFIWTKTYTLESSLEERQCPIRFDTEDRNFEGSSHKTPKS